MFKFLKELVDAAKEGWDEGIEEVAQEEAASLEEQTALIERCNTLAERMKKDTQLYHQAIALACPFRYILVSSGDDYEYQPHLYDFGQLKEKEIEEVKQFLKRDFEIEDNETALETIESYFEMNEDASQAERIFNSSTQLYILTASIDAGYLEFSEREQDIAVDAIKVIAKSNVGSWKEFSDKFLEGDDTNNMLGSIYVKKAIKHLLASENSPWNVLSWRSACRVMYEE